MFFSTTRNTRCIHFDIFRFRFDPINNELSQIFPFKIVLKLFFDLPLHRVSGYRSLLLYFAFLIIFIRVSFFFFFFFQSARQRSFDPRHGRRLRSGSDVHDTTFGHCIRSVVLPLHVAPITRPKRQQYVRYVPSIPSE